MAAEGLITLDELRTKLAALEETRDTARRELSALEARQELLAQLERDRDTLMEQYAGMTPEALDNLSPEERHSSYKLLKLRVDMHLDGTLEVSGVLRKAPEVCNPESIYLYDLNFTHARALRFHTLLGEETSAVELTLT